jgi:hypothetical protein
MPISGDPSLSAVAPGAREFIAAGLASLDHACAHAADPSAGDAAQTVMSLAHGIEMLCKGMLLHRGESIHQRGNLTVSLREALIRVGPVRHAASVQVLADRRDSIQHSAAYMDPRSVQDYVRLVDEFANDLLRETGIVLKPCLTRIGTVPAHKRPGVERVDSLQAGQQRDADFEHGALVWAQGHTTLRIRASRGGSPYWLSPEGAFEYAPRTDGVFVVAYRQSGGVVVYDLANRSRDLVTETGGPGAVAEGVIAVQGLGVADGLGGGVSLVAIDGSGVEKLSDTGDSPQIDFGRVIWQDFRDGDHLVMSFDLNLQTTSILLRGARHSSIHEDLLAWEGTNAATSGIYARNLATGEEKRVSDSGIFPNVRKGRVAYLAPRDGTYDVVVVDWATGTEQVRVNSVGFPRGRGPVLTDSEVLWESGSMSSEMLLWRFALPVVSHDARS